MTQQDYEQKKRECWENIKFALRAPNTDRKTFDFIFDRAYALGKKAAELSSNSEQLNAAGEDEMLCVSRKEIQQLVEANDVVILEAAGIDNIETIQAKTVNTILSRLFGSKCLPDEEKPQPQFHKGDRVKVITDCWKDKVYTVTDVNGIYPQFSYKLSCSPDVWFAESTLELAKEPKAAGPKYGSDDKVTLNGYGGFVITSSYLDPYTREYKYRLGGFKGHFCESDLEPYTEPGKEAQNPETSPETAGLWHAPMSGSGDASAVLNDFGGDRRLNIAAMAMQGILSNIDLFTNVLETGMRILGGDDRSYRAVAKASFLFADALISEAEKGGGK